MTGQSEQEEWRDVVGYEGLYQVSSWGQVRSKKNNKLLKQKKGATGQKRNYAVYRVDLCDGINKPKTCRIHRLVACAFIPNPESKYAVDHIDGNALNNQVSNLRWATHGQNGANMKKHRGSSQYKGVSRHKQKAKWQSAIKNNYLGLHICEHAAATTYNNAAKEFFGEYALLNDVANCNCKECVGLKS